MVSREWGFGDRVIHAKRPEWGHGVITSADRTVQDGVACQRVVVRFDRAGVKTLSTALAELEPAPDGPQLDERPAHASEHSSVSSSSSASASTGPGENATGWLDRLSAANPDEVMCRLPENTTDPFRTLEQRLRSTLDLYRFNESGGSLLDWAASQTGLKDPLSRFNRHELERFFKRFAFVRDDHLKKLVLEYKKKDPTTLSTVLKGAPPSANHSLRRLDLIR
jgi:hypothetical protein